MTSPDDVPPGRDASKAKPKEAVTLLNTRVLRRLYAACVQARGLRRKHPLAAHEAVLAGISVRLTPADVLVASPDDAVLEHMRAGSGPARRGRDLVVAESSATVLGVATGLAVAMRTQRGSNVVVSLTRPQPGGVDYWHDVLRMAGEMSLPIVFVVDGSRQRLNVAAEPFGFPTITVDVRDPIAVYRVTEEAIKRARRRLGATLIACVPWKQTDALRLVESYLRGSRHWSEEWAREVRLKYEREIGRTRR